MKNKSYLFASLLAGAMLFASCEDKYQPVEATDPDSQAMSFTVEATLPAVTGEGMRTAFLDDDLLRIRFADANGAKVGRTQLLRRTAGEGKSATFSADGISVPNNAATVYAFLDNSTTNAIAFGAAPTVNDLSAQNGTLADAVAHQVISGSAAISAGKASVALSYKTSIVKAVVTYPAEVTPTEGETTITLSCEQFDKVYIDLDATAKSTKGDITVNASIDGNKAYAYFAVWGSLGNGTIFSNIASTKYGHDINPTGVGAGKSSVLEEAVETLVYSYKISDDEFKLTDVRGNLVKADEWITLSAGVITVAENKTGSIRTGSILLDNDKTYIFTQFGVNEFTGAWTLYSKLFDGSKRMGGSKNDFTTTVTISLANGENGNNVTISGLYPGTSVEGKVDIDYEGMTAKIGVYCSSKKIYKSSLGYVALLPECASAASGSYWTGYNFCAKNPGDFSDTDYDWLWFTLNDDYSVAKYQYYGAGQFSANGNYKYCGLSFVVASETAITGTAYDLIHQANFNTNNSESMYFKR